MRKKMIAGNWKMNKTVIESIGFADTFLDLVDGIDDPDILICAPFTTLSSLKDKLAGSKVKLGAQNMHFEDRGAFTAEISPLMLKELVEYVMIGHSERRHVFNETDANINKKMKKALETGLIPILCVGELLEQRKAGKTEEIVTQQLKSGLKEIDEKQAKKIIFAYEPVWAISGQDPNHPAATPDDAEEVHVLIRKLLSELYSEGFAEKARILYGGSMKPDNCNALNKMPNIDGGLVGGASLEPKSLAKVVKWEEQ